MKVTDLGENECILCTTKEECNKILDLMHEAGLKWFGGKSYKENRMMYFHSEGQCYFPKNGTHDRKEYFSSKGFKIYNASEFLEHKYKMGDKVVYDGEICYFVCHYTDYESVCIIEKKRGWDRDFDIPEEYISKLSDEYRKVCIDEITPYVEQTVEQQLEVKEEIFEKKETYPNWVKKIAEEESRIQGLYNDEEYDIGSGRVLVWKNFTWGKSRQGGKCWNNIYYDKDYSLLKQRAKDNGYEYEDKKTLRKVSDLGDDEYIYCSNEEENNKICKLLYEAGYTLPNGNSYLDHKYSKGIPYLGKDGCMCDYLFDDFDFKSYPASDYIEDKLMNKVDIPVYKDLCNLKAVSPETNTTTQYTGIVVHHTDNDYSVCRINDCTGEVYREFKGNINIPKRFRI